MGQDLRVTFVRFQAALPNARGAFPGVFALCNGLARTGRLSDDDWAWWRANNDALQLLYLDPATVDSTLFDRGLHPQVTCWFRQSATHLLDRTAGYLDLLDRYGIDWVQLRAECPGLVLYEDDDQVVVEPLPQSCGGMPAT